MEIWKDIEGYEGLYQVSNLGNILSNNLYAHKKPKLKKLQKHNSGYVSVSLSKDGHDKSYLVHRLVAQAFLENPNGYDFVNHKDENKRNNNVENLEWCTKSYNSTYYLNMKPERKKEYGLRFRDKETGESLSQWTKHKPHTNFKKVKQMNLEGRVIKVYENSVEAAQQTGFICGNILTVCKWNKDHSNKRTSKGYIWEFED